MLGLWVGSKNIHSNEDDMPKTFRSEEKEASKQDTQYNEESSQKMQLKLKVNHELKLQKLMEVTEQTKSFELSH